MTRFKKACYKEASSLKRAQPNIKQQLLVQSAVFTHLFASKANGPFFGVYIEQCLLDSFHIRCHFMKPSFLFLAIPIKAVVLMSIS